MAFLTESGLIALKTPHFLSYSGKIHAGTAPVKISPFVTLIWQFLAIITFSLSFKTESIAAKMPELEPFVRIKVCFEP